MAYMASGYEKLVFTATSSQLLNRASLSELLHRRDELRFLSLQHDSGKAMEDLRSACIEEELAEVEREIYILSNASKSLADEERSAAEEDLLRQERIR